MGCHRRVSSHTSCSRRGLRRQGIMRANSRLAYGTTCGDPLLLPWLLTTLESKSLATHTPTISSRRSKKLTTSQLTGRAIFYRHQARVGLQKTNPRHTRAWIRQKGPAQVPTRPTNMSTACASQGRPHSIRGQSTTDRPRHLPTYRCRSHKAYPRCCWHVCLVLTRGRPHDGCHHELHRLTTIKRDGEVRSRGQIIPRLLLDTSQR